MAWPGSRDRDRNAMAPAWLSKPSRDASRDGDASSRPIWPFQAPRVAILGWAILLILGLYFIRLWQLQFLEGGAWRARAVQQQSRLITLSPSRGVIYDRNGDILVRNVPAYNVTVTPGQLPDDEDRRREVLVRLAQLLEDVEYSTSEGLDLPEYRTEIGGIGRADFPPFGEVPARGLLEMVEEVKWLVPFTPIVVARNVERDLALLIAQESGVTMPGVDIETVPERRYTYGALMSQILGFLGPIPPERVMDFEQKGYNVNVDRIGYAGIEARLEESLHGIPGRKVIERNILGQELAVLSETPPGTGDTVYLTIDVQLQAVAEAALRKGLLSRAQLCAECESDRGVAIALDPRDGQVLAIVSLPTYDNNLFSGKLDLDAYEQLLKDPHRPFINHAIADQIPPGSVFKVIPAAAALQEGVINRFTTLNCPGRIYLPNRFVPDDPSLAQPFYCWIDLQYGYGHGPLNVVDALAQSCDIFFYQVGGGWEATHFQGLGVERLAAYSREFGLGAPTGLDIPGEAGGLVPTPRWKRELYQETWTTGNTYNFVIGQGDVLVTPLQIANMMAAVANGGTLYQPQLIHHVVDAAGQVIQPFTPVISHTLAIDRAVWEVVREGLDVTVSATGTGSRAMLDEDLGINLAGKTGTAEYCDDIALKAGRCDIEAHEVLPTHAWFMAYGPVEAPEIVVVVWVYDGGEGSVTAAPVAREILDYYFRQKLGLPPSESE
jgi:penicillin-binding protein 2